MRLSISDTKKKQLFVSLFQVLRSCSSAITIFFHPEKMYIQGMDASHVCLFDMTMLSGWFDTYELGQDTSITVSVYSTFFHTILSMVQEQQTIFIEYQEDSDVILIQLIANVEETKGDFNKFFTLPLLDIDNNLLDIPLVEYDAEFTILAKKMGELVSQLSNFGNVINIKCNEEAIHVGTKGIGGEMIVHIPMDDLSEFSISEGDELCMSYSLHYIHKMCVTTKLSADIHFSISHEYPLKIHYDLGNESFIAFYMAPKIDD
uniref:Proliferating cell nuclear antigen PCNA N-terminal domain-containing protein n=1 Tax=viral metagenome TaxID=1070528 RepID=A0A6C0AZE3_9ZZZZ